MRKMVFGRKLSRGRKSREALFRSLIKALIIYGKIETTKAKAKAIQGDIDKVVMLAKAGSLASGRRVSAFLGNDRKLTEILFGKIAKTFSARPSGFTRMTLLPSRKGDAAEMARLEWTEPIKEEQIKKEPGSKKMTKGKEEGKKEKAKARKKSQ